MGDAPAAPSLAVIICHHTGHLVERCLASVRASQGVTPEVIVVTSTDQEWPDVLTLHSQEGPAYKRNWATRFTSAEYLAFLDDDIEVSRYCLYQLLRFAQEHPTAGMVFAKILNMERRNEFDDCGSWLTFTGFLWARAGNYQRDEGQFDTPQRILASKSATCLVRSKSFIQVGGFDKSYFILGEDTDLAWRLWLRGWEVWYAPLAVSWHAFGCESIKPRADYYTIQRTMTYGCRNYLSMLWTNLGRRRRRSILPLHLTVWVIASIGFWIRRDRPRARGIWQGLQEFFYRMPELRRKRQHVQLTRLIADRDLFRHVYTRPKVSYYLKRLWRYWTTQLHG